MGLTPQPNKWQCGPFALKHALIMLGKIVDEKELSRKAGTHWSVGTDEVKLARAARAHHCTLKVIRYKNPLHAKRELLRQLKRRHPVLLCVDGWSHWITVVGAEKGRFITIDSRSAPMICVDTWKALKKRWVYRETNGQDPKVTETLYDLHPLIPRFRTRTKAHFSLEHAFYLRRPENRAFASNWDEYFTDLANICRPWTPQSERVFPLGELLRRHGAMIRTQIPYWHGKVQARQVNKILRNMQFVADTYDFVIHEEDEKRALVAITANLAFWAASKYGVGEIYGNP
jgi:hypothetical protein